MKPAMGDKVTTDGNRDFPDSSVAKTPHFQCREHKFDPLGGGACMSHSVQKQRTMDGNIVTAFADRDFPCVMLFVYVLK